MSQIPIYEAMVAAGVEISNHYSDLYVPKNEVTAAIVRQYFGSVTTTIFTCQLDGKSWYDIPFAFLPYWERRAQQENVI